MQQNHTKYILHSATYSTFLMMIAGSVIQAFLLENGLSDRVVTLYLSVVQMVQVSVILIVSLIIDRIRNVLRAFAISTVLQMVMFLSLIPLCLFHSIPLTGKYLLVFSAGIITNIVQAFYNSLTYKAPYHVIDMEQFSTVSGLVGVISGALCILVSAAMSFFTANAGEHYNTIMLCFFLLGAAMLLASFLLILSFSPVPPKTDYSPHQGEKINLFSYKPFYALLLPNLLRGFSTGILGVAMTVGHSMNITNQSSGAILTLLLQISSVIGCSIFSVIAKKGGGRIIFASSIGLFISMPLMLATTSLTMFYVMYFCSNFFACFVNYAIPVSITKFVDYRYIGQYSSWRMLLHTLGVAVSGALVTGMIGVFGGFFTLLIGALCQFLSGTGYYLFMRKISRDL